MSKIEVNDLFEELTEENDRLLSQLLLANKCIQLLEKYRNCLKSFHSSCICHKNVNNKNEFNLLENQYKNVFHDNCEVTQIENGSKTVQLKSHLNKRLEICPNTILNNEFDIKTSLKANYSYDSNDTLIESADKNQIISHNQLSDQLVHDKSNETDYHKASRELNESQNKPQKHSLPKNKLLIKLRNNELMKEVHRDNDLILVLREKTKSSNGIHHMVGYECNWPKCHYVTVHKKQIISHTSTRHTEERSLNCDECEAKFAHSQHLDQHRKVHLISALERGWPQNSIDFKSNKEFENNQTNNLNPFIGDRSNSNEQFMESLSENQLNLNGQLRDGLIYDKNNDSDYDINEDSADHKLNKNRYKYKQTKHFLRKKELLIKLENNELIKEVHKDNDLILALREKTKSSNAIHYMVGYECNWFGCDYVSSDKKQMISHVDFDHTKNDSHRKLKISANGNQHFSDMELSGESIDDTNDDSDFDINGDTINQKLNKKSQNKYQKHFLTKKEILLKLRNNELTKEVHRDNDHILALREKTKSNNGIHYMVGYQCNWSKCGYVTIDKKQMISHINTKHTNECTFSCDECEAVFAHFKRLDKHRKRVHNNIDQHDLPPNSKCKQVKHLLSQKQLLVKLKNNELIKEIDMNNELIITLREKSISSSGVKQIVGFQCNWPECDHVIRYRSQLISHINAIHKQIITKPFSCDECEAKFANNYQLCVHRKSVHSKNTYKCDWPECQFVTKSDHYLRSHKLRHGNKPFKCDWPGCDWSFRTNYEKKYHMNNIHSDSRPYRCEWPGCEYKTKAVKYLTVHKRIHTGYKPFKCDWPQCEAKFTDSSRLSKHKRIHTRIRRS